MAATSAERKKQADLMIRKAYVPPRPCPKCRGHFDTPIQFYCHSECLTIVGSQSEPQFLCPRCPERFAKQAFLTQHFGEAHCNRPGYQCRFYQCGYESEDLDDIRIHVLGEHQPLEFICRTIGCYKLHACSDHLNEHFRVSNHNFTTYEDLKSRLSSCKNRNETRVIDCHRHTGTHSRSRDQTHDRSCARSHNRSRGPCPDWRQNRSRERGPRSRRRSYDRRSSRQSSHYDRRSDSRSDYRLFSSRSDSSSRLRSEDYSSERRSPFRAPDISFDIVSVGTHYDENEFQMTCSKGCGRTFDQMSDFTAHAPCTKAWQQADGTLKYYCTQNDCLFRGGFISIEELKFHICYEHLKPSFACRFCHKSTYTRADMEQHVRVTHPEELTNKQNISSSTRQPNEPAFDWLGRRSDRITDLRPIAPNPWIVPRDPRTMSRPSSSASVAQLSPEPSIIEVNSGADHPTFRPAALIPLAITAFVQQRRVSANSSATTMTTNGPPSFQQLLNSRNQLLSERGNRTAHQARMTEAENIMQQLPTKSGPATARHVTASQRFSSATKPIAIIRKRASTEQQRAPYAAKRQTETSTSYRIPKKTGPPHPVPSSTALSRPAPLPSNHSNGSDPPPPLVASIATDPQTTPPSKMVIKMAVSVQDMRKEFATLCHSLQHVVRKQPHFRPQVIELYRMACDGKIGEQVFKQSCRAMGCDEQWGQLISSLTKNVPHLTKLLDADGAALRLLYRSEKVSSSSTALESPVTGAVIAQHRENSTSMDETTRSPDSSSQVKRKTQPPEPVFEEFVELTEDRRFLLITTD